METKKGKFHSDRGNIIYQTKYISKLFEEKKFRQAKLLITELLEEYGNDNVLIYEWTRILAFEGKYEEAYKQLSSLQETEEYYYFFLTVLAILSKNYEAMEYYYYKYFQNEINYSHNIREHQKQAVQIYLQKIFEPDKEINTLNFPQRGRDAYYLKQLANYDFDQAYCHIVNNHVNTSKHDKSVFNPTIDIKELLKQLKVEIEAHRGESHLINLQEVYYFNYPHCGKNQDQVDYSLNNIMVSTIFNTSDILTAYPCRENVIYQPLYLSKKEKEVSAKELKRVSQIDKFNMRYGKK